MLTPSVRSESLTKRERGVKALVKLSCPVLIRVYIDLADQTSQQPGAAFVVGDGYREDEFYFMKIKSVFPGNP